MNYTRFKRPAVYALVGLSVLTGLRAFAGPEKLFPKGTENCTVFLRGGHNNNQGACIACCEGSIDAKKSDIPVAVGLCKKYSDPKPGTPIPPDPPVTPPAATTAPAAPIKGGKANKPKTGKNSKTDKTAAKDKSGSKN